MDYCAVSQSNSSFGGPVMLTYSYYLILLFVPAGGKLGGNLFLDCRNFTLQIKPIVLCFLSDIYKILGEFVWWEAGLLVWFTTPSSVFHAMKTVLHLSNCIGSIHPITQQESFFLRPKNSNS